MKPSAARLEKLYEQRRSVTGKKNAATASWTPERERLLTAMWTEGASCSQIAGALGEGATRNAVIGKVHRLKLPPRRSSPPRSNYRYAKRAGAPPRPKKPRVSKPLAHKAYIAAPWASARLLPEPMPGDMERLRGDAWAPLPNSAPMPLLAVAEADGCRWPIGEDRPYSFCGNPIHTRHYCESHYALSRSGTNRVYAPRIGGGEKILDAEFA